MSQSSPSASINKPATHREATHSFEATRIPCPIDPAALAADAAV